jgi:hypothetical protein
VRERVRGRERVCVCRKMIVRCMSISIRRRMPIFIFSFLISKVPSALPLYSKCTSH